VGDCFELDEIFASDIANGCCLGFAPYCFLYFDDLNWVCKVVTRDGMGWTERCAV
jgi:hypothetical protein